MIYTVSEISGEKGWHDFLSLPSEIYRDDPNWIAPQVSETRRLLDAGKNPYFMEAVLKLFICYCDNKPVSRSILVINHRHWERWNKKSAFFGFFESVNDMLAAKTLFEKIEAESRSLGAEYLEGPFNPNHYSELGILVNNFGIPPIFFETYNPPYYSQLLAEAGFSELCRFHTRLNDDMPSLLAKIQSAKTKGDIDKDIVIKRFRLGRMKKELEIMREINNDAFEGNWYFLPLTRAEYLFSAKFMFLVTTPRLVLFAEYKGEPVGLLQCVVNFNRLIKPYKGKLEPWHLPALLMKRKSLKELVIFTVGIKKAFQHTGVSAALVNSALEIFKKYDSVSTTWISDENKAVIHVAGLFGMKPYKYFSIYSKSLK